MDHHATSRPHLIEGQWPLKTLENVEHDWKESRANALAESFNSVIEGT